jgi:hypothetical protein
MRVDALLNGQELGGDVVDDRRDGPFVSLGLLRSSPAIARSWQKNPLPRLMIARRQRTFAQTGVL